MIGILLAEVYERVGKSAISVCHERTLKELTYKSAVKKTRNPPGFCDFFQIKNEGASIAVKRKAAFYGLLKLQS